MMLNIAIYARKVQLFRNLNFARCELIKKQDCSNILKDKDILVKIMIYIELKEHSTILLSI